MSKAYICDRCGRILPPDARVHGLWDVDPWCFDKHANLTICDLCDECYAQFEREYKANLNMEADV